MSPRARAAVVDPPAWRNRITGSGTEDPAQLLANPLNWRTHPGPQRDALRGSLSEIGWVQQVLVNTTTGHMVDGHARVEEALSRGEASVPVLYLELSDAEERVVLASLDPIGAMAIPDNAKLAELLADVTVTDEHLVQFMASLRPGGRAGLTDADDVPPLTDETSVRPGDLFALGDHRVMCGDSTSGSDVDRLMGGSLAQMVMADPPYNVDYRGGSSTKSQERADAYPDKFADYEAWLTLVLTAAYAASDDKAALHLWHASKELRSVLHACDAARWQDRTLIVWDKGSVKGGLGQTGKQYRNQFEPMLYCHKKNRTPRWFGPSNESDIWAEKGPSASPLHPTMKPVALYERCLSNHTAGADIVLECFGGSGTTLIAAEQLGRRCYSMEIEPRYVQVAIERWQAFTGKTAEKLA